MSNYFPEELIEEIRLSNDIVDVVSEYVKLEKRGKYYFGLCPFHAEKTPSFTVTPSMQIFNCFGCNKGGNVIHFIMNIENLDFVEAVKYLADRAGISIPDRMGENDEKAARLRQEVMEIHKVAARYFYNNLNSPSGMKAREYLKNRGILDETIRRFGLGYSLPGYDNLYKYLLDKGYDKKDILESGLVIKTERQTYIDRFRDRVMFPILDLRGNVVGFGGRVMGSSLPKYMNSPETVIYSKGKSLYALNFARDANQGSLIVVEGYMDVISLHQNGIINSVASLGTALTENQARLMRKYAEEIIIAYDADTAGQAATLRSLDLLRKIGCTVKILEIPDGKDPDEFIRNNGADAFRELISNSMTFVEYKINLLKKEVDTENTEGKIKFINKAAKILSEIDSRIEMEVYADKIAREYNISRDSLYAEILKQIDLKRNAVKLKTGNPKTNISGNNTKNIKTTKKSDNNYIELLLFAILCIDNNIYKLIKDKIDINDFTGNNREIARVVFKKLDSGGDVVTAELLNIMDTETAAQFSRIVEKECSFEDINDINRAAHDIINKLTDSKKERRKMEILKMLKNRDNMSNEEVQRLLEEFNNLVREQRVNIYKERRGNV